MVEVRPTRIWLRWVLFVALFVGLALAALLPLTTYQPIVLTIANSQLILPMGSFAPPDLLLALTCAWVVRRPDFVPVWVLAPLYLAADFVFLRPPGLWAAVVVIGAEVLRRRAGALRASTFTAEWLTVGLAILLMTLGYRFALALSLTDRPPLHLVVTQAVLTVAIYPLVAGLSHLFFGVRRVAPGEVDGLGHRL